MEQLLLRQLTMRHVGFLLSATSFGFQVGEKYILGIIQYVILIIPETCQLVRKLTVLFYLIFSQNYGARGKLLQKICLKGQLRRNLCILHKGAETLPIHGAGVNVLI